MKELVDLKEDKDTLREIFFSSMFKMMTIKVKTEISQYNGSNTTKVSALAFEKEWKVKEHNNLLLSRLRAYSNK